MVLGMTVPMPPPRRFRREALRHLLQFMRVFAAPRAHDPATERLLLLVWAFVALLAIFVVAWVSLSSFAINTTKLGIVVGIGLAVRVLASQARRRLRLQAPPMLLEALVVMSLMSGFAVLTSFELVSRPVALRDASLAAIDLHLGFDWVAYHDWLVAHPKLTSVLQLAYGSLSWQMAAVIFLLSMRMCHRRLATFLAAWAVALGLTLAVFSMAPCNTAYVHYQSQISTGQNLSRAVGEVPAKVIRDLRSGNHQHLLDDSLEGIVAFPSFHTAGAVLLTWALWPVRWLGWASAALNGLMLLAVPVIGAHYFVDLLGGLVVAALSLAGARMVMRYLQLHYDA